MSNKSRHIIGFLLILFTQMVNAQVVFREYLSQNHSGRITQSVNFPNKILEYEWIFLDMEKGAYFAEGEAIQKIKYQLLFKVDGKQVGSFDLQMRDLIVTYYVEIEAKKEDTSRTITAIYHKANRWVKLKGVLQEGCRRSGVSWGRQDAVESYDQLLQFIVQQIDKNVDLSCYF